MLVPNLNVSPNFHPNTVTMKDRTVHTGHVEAGAPAGVLRLRVVTGQVMELDSPHIAKQQPSEKSHITAVLTATPPQTTDIIP